MLDICLLGTGGMDAQAQPLSDSHAGKAQRQACP